MCTGGTTISPFGKKANKMKRNEPKTFYALVKVESGVPVDVRLYKNEKSARRAEELSRRNLNLENDETGVFEVSL